MPYPRAHYFVGLVLVVIVIGFWGSYFTSVTEGPIAFHVHALTATSWVLLLMYQHWAIHGGHRSAHRLAGKLSLILFPFLIVGLVMIINVTARSFASAEPGSPSLGPSVALTTFFAIVAYLVLYFLALRHRRNVSLHAGYMLTTPLVLFESPFSRILLDHLDFLIFTSSVAPQRIVDAIVIGMSMAIAFALVMYLLDRRRGIPFLVAAALIAVQAIATYQGISMEWAHRAFAAYASYPPAVMVAIGFMLGVAVSWLGWQYPANRVATRSAMA